MLKKIAAGGAAIALGFLLVTNPVVADAAKQITGKDIKNNSVTGKDIKDNSLTGKDIKNGKITTADLAAKTVSALSTPSYKFTLPQNLTPSESHSFTFPGIKPGRYFATYSVVARGSGGGIVGPLECKMRANAASADIEAFNWGIVEGGDAAVSASTELTLTAAPPLLECVSFTSGNWAPYPDEWKSVVTFTKVDPKSGGAVGASRPSAGTSGPGAR